MMLLFREKQTVLTETLGYLRYKHETKYPQIAMTWIPNSRVLRMSK